MGNTLIKILLGIGIVLLVGCDTQDAPTAISLQISQTPISRSLTTPILVATPVQPTAQPIPLTAAGNPSTPLSVELTLANSPRINTETQLTLTIRSIKPAPTTNATILLPAGVELVTGNLTWQGAITPEQPHTLAATIRFTHGGNFTLTGKALNPFDNGDIWGDQASLYITISDPQQPNTNTSSPTPPLAVPSP